MRRSVLILVLIFGSSVLVNAQGLPATLPTPAPGTGPINSDRQKNISGRSDNLRLTEKFPVLTDANSKVFRQSIRPLYRSSKKVEKEIVAPAAEDTEKYAAFLSQKNTGLIKLVADQGCDKNFGVIVSSEHCGKYTMPGAGSSYSFREGDYRMRSLADLIFTGQLFQSVGTLIQGIFVDVGDIPLEQVGLQTDGVKYLMSIEPSTNMDAATEFTEKLLKGIEDGNFTYRGLVQIGENRTYILRSIAYRGNNYRTVQGMTFDELDFDKRKDLTVAFRVVRRDADEAVTILWKVLADQKSPKIKKMDN